MARKLIPFAGAGILVIAVLAASVSVFSGDEKGLLRPDDARIIAQGREIYRENCASCHGKNLEGQPEWKTHGPDGKLPAPPHDDSGHTWHHADQLLFDLTKFGLKKFAGEDYKSNMPAYETVLTDAEIIAALSFIKSRWSEGIRARHDRMNAASKQN